MRAQKGTVLLGMLIIVMALLLLTTTSAYAAPVDDVPVTVTQPDGEELHLFASGDEYYNWLHDAEGYTIIQDPDNGYYVYADLVNGELIPTEFVAGRADPGSAGLSPRLNISPEQKNEIRQEFQNLARQARAEIHSAPQTGTITNLVVFIRFSGESEFTDATSIYTNMLNSSTAGANSLRNYYREVSYNALTINSSLFPTPGTTVISYQDSHTRGYFQPYNATTNPSGYTGADDGVQRGEREHTLLRDAINHVTGLGQFPAGATIDADGDGFVDSITFIVSGSPTGWSSLLWPHAWSLSTYTVMINGKQVDGYAFQLESTVYNGVLAHEMFHVLGAPDLYHYSSSSIAPVGAWDVMEVDLDPPQHMGCYMKFRYGAWISSIPPITAPGTYTLNPLTSSTNNCYKIASPNSTTEYFVVEYRRQASSTFENSLPGTGLLVYRINTNQDGMGNADGPPDEVYIYRPGGTTSQDGNVNTANFSSNVGRTTINDTTDPSSFLSNGSAGGLDICNVGGSNATITFQVGCNLPVEPVLVSPSGSITNTTPTYTWNKVNNATWYYLWVNGPSGNVIKKWYTSAQANCNATTCSITPATTLGGGAHIWWVQTWNSFGYGPWSNGMSFSITPPGAATLVSPSGFITNKTPAYTWNKVDSATWYYLWVNNPSGTAVIQQWYQSSAVCGASTCSITPATTLSLGNHQWWIQTWNPGGYGPWSSAMNFSVQPTAPVTLNSPSGSITDTTPTYTWNKENSATWYYLWVNDATGTPMIKQWYESSTVCGASTCSITPSVPLGGGGHTWWIQTWNSGGYGPWSIGMNFSLPAPDFNSQFNGSASDWQVHSGSWYIDSSAWYTTAGSPGYWDSISYNATYSNLDYQAMLWRSGYSATFLNIRGGPLPLSGDNDWNAGYSFGYTPDGNFSVWKSTGGGVWSALQNWAFSSAINQSEAWNTLRVVANGSNMYFYINGSLVWSGTDSSLSVGRVGIEMFDADSGDQLWVDWATLSTSVLREVSDKVSPEQRALNDSANAAGSANQSSKKYQP